MLSVNSLHSGFIYGSQLMLLVFFYFPFKYVSQVGEVGQCGAVNDNCCRVLLQPDDTAHIDDICLCASIELGSKVGYLCYRHLVLVDAQGRQFVEPCACRIAYEYLPH